MKILKIVAINIFMIVALFYGVSRFLLSSSEVSKKPGPVITIDDSEEYMEPDPILGFRLKKNMTVRVSKKVDDLVLYDVEYKIDQFHRRITPQTEDSKRDQFLIFVGDSNTFGEGVQQNETLAAHTAKIVESHRVYNYAVGGHGSGNVLALLESDRLPKEISEKKGFVVYPFKHYLAKRLVGTIGFFGWSDGKHPFYETGSDGKVYSKGSFYEQDWLRFKLFKFISSLSFWQSLEGDYPDPFGPSYFPLVCQSFVQMNESVENKFRDSHFIVTLSIQSKKQFEKLRDCFSKNKIKWFDVSKVYKEHDPKTIHHHELDGHYTSKAHKLMAEELARRLSEFQQFD